MLKINIETGTAWVKPIYIPGDENSDILDAIDWAWKETNQLEGLTFTLEDVDGEEDKRDIIVNGNPDIRVRGSHIEEMTNEDIIDLMKKKEEKEKYDPLEYLFDELEKSGELRGIMYEAYLNEETVTEKINEYEEDLLKIMFAKKTRKKKVWLTNHPKDSSPKEIIENNLNQKGRHIIIGEPKATKKFTVEELKKMDLVGIYEII